MNNIIHECITKRGLLEILFKYPNREFTINELSKLSGISYATAWRFVQRIDKAGIILCKKVGHSFSCKLNLQSPLTLEIDKLLKIKPSPQRAVLDGFLRSVKKFKEIKKIILFGSVAIGKEKLTSDVDVVLLVSRKDSKLKNKITDIVDDIAVKSKVIIVPLILTFNELSKNKQFQQEINKGEVLYVRH